MTKFTSLSDCFTLVNGVKIPCVGFGTYKSLGDEGYTSTLEALKVGYRHIDTAALYRNEAQIGQALRDSGLPREEVFITTKLWNDFRSYDEALQAFEDSLVRLGVDYVDLYLIHWPAHEGHYPGTSKQVNQETWRALETIYRSGKARAIGVSNFKVHHLKQLQETQEIAPMVNQIEYHPGWLQVDLVTYCKEHNILVQAYSPLGQTRVLQHPTLVELGQKYGVSPAQICLRVALEDGVLPLPKSVTPARIAQNAQVFHFILTPEDLLLVRAGGVYGWSGNDSDLKDNFPKLKDLLAQDLAQAKA